MITESKILYTLDCDNCGDELYDEMEGKVIEAENIEYLLDKADRMEWLITESDEKPTSPFFHDDDDDDFISEHEMVSKLKRKYNHYCPECFGGYSDKGEILLKYSDFDEESEKEGFKEYYPKGEGPDDPDFDFDSL